MAQTLWQALKIVAEAITTALLDHLSKTRNNGKQ